MNKNVEAMVKGLEAVARLTCRLNVAMEKLTIEEVVEFHEAMTDTPLGRKESKFLTEDIITVLDDLWGYDRG